MRRRMPLGRVVWALLGTAAPVAAQGAWVRQLPVHSPPARGWHGFTYDGARGVHVLFGGSVPSLGGTWEWDGSDWTLRTTANAPLPRFGHGMTYDWIRARIVLCGGATSPGVVVGDTWEFDGVDWIQRLPLHSPPPREITGMGYLIANGRSILFGGLAATGATLNDTWAWDGTDWVQVTTVHAPSARFAFGAATDLHRGVLVFGGYSGASDLSDIWAFDGSDWAQLPASQSPPGLANTSVAADEVRGMIVQFGGYPAATNGQETDDTWIHDGADWRLDTRPPGIGPRRSVALSYDVARDRFVLFGGYAGGYLDQTWEYSLTGAAEWSIAGAGCSGTQGVPELLPAGPQRAILGTNFQLAVTGGVTGGAVFALGFSNTSWNGTPLPLSLAGYGMPGCQLHTSIDALVFRTGVGSAQCTVPIPATPGLVGLRLHAQALVPQPGANPLGAVVSNALTAVVGSF